MAALVRLYGWEASAGNSRVEGRAGVGVLSLDTVKADGQLPEIGKRGKGPISAQKKGLRVNRQIRAREVRVVDTDGKQLGVMPLREALALAEERGLDLVEVAPHANPPVCRLLNYSKYMYELQKKAREARKAQKQVEVKEIRLRPWIGEHDLEFKVRDARRFLTKGNKVRFRVQFRGREIEHADMAKELLQNVASQLADVGFVEAAPRMEGAFMVMVMAPHKS